jgi:beta-glucanase (GH16 family)
MNYHNKLLFQKIFTLIILLFAYAMRTQAQQLSFIQNADGTTDTLELVFNEEFEGKKINERVWNVVEGVVRDPEGKRVKCWTKKSNIEVADGLCTMWVRRDTLLNQKYEVWVKDGMKPFVNDYHFSVSEMNTHQQYGYGLYEIRCKIPRGRGLAPAYWMYGANGPINCEIDVFEFWNQRGFLTRFSKRKLSRVHNMTAHYNGRMSGTSYMGPDYSEDYFVYSVVWDECRLEWYVNGDLKRRISRYKKMRANEISCDRFANMKTKPEENVFPQNQLMSIIANFAVHTDEDKPYDTDPFPNKMVIDYIRYFKFK